MNKPRSAVPVRSSRWLGDPMPRLVLVEWLDSHLTPQWTTEAPPEQGLLCRSVGWLVYDGKDAKTVAAHMTVEDNPQRSGQMTIPACAIIKIRRLR